MHRIIIFGNSGSGKSTQAKALANRLALAHLDLDVLAWQATTPPQRVPLARSQQDIDAFIASHNDWVIEGCYADLLAMAISHATQVLFMNLPIEACVANARQRPWEPHKYPSKDAQDANLAMLIDWIRQYDARQDTFSRQAHEALYQAFTGTKSMLTENPSLRAINEV